MSAAGADPGELSVLRDPPDSPRLADDAKEVASAYVHVPFCARICPYCDFAVVAGRDDLAGRYVDALVAEIEVAPLWRPLDAVFVGGGTPSRLPAERLGAVLAALSGRFGLRSSAEISLEANPEDWTTRRAGELVDAGFTRVSLGAQSFDPDVLDSLGRRHRPEDVVAAVGAAREAGFRSVNLDLVFGAAGESDSSWGRTVERALDLEPDHVSVYALTVEPGTALWREVRAGAPAPDPDSQARRWEEAQGLMAASGLVRYEVSNAARPGHVCIYNLGVWARGEYLGFGLGAHGHRRGVRTRNVRRLDTYLHRVETGMGPVQAREASTGWVGEQERLMLGLRLAAGVTAGEAGMRLLRSPEGRRLVDAGVLELRGDRLVTARPLLTDEAARAVLALDPPRKAARS